MNFRVLPLVVMMVLAMIVSGCSSNKDAIDKQEPKPTAVQSDVSKAEPQIDTKVFQYASKVDITDARSITKHITVTVFMSDDLTQPLATQHVINQSYRFLQQEDIKGANTVTIGVMHGNLRVFQYTVDMTKFKPNGSEPMTNVVLKASKVEKMSPDVEVYAKAVEWKIINS